MREKGIIPWTYASGRQPMSRAPICARDTAGAELLKPDCQIAVSIRVRGTTHRQPSRRQAIVPFKRNRLIIARIFGCSRHSRRGQNALRMALCLQLRKSFARHAVKEVPDQHGC